MSNVCYPSMRLYGAQHDLQHELNRIFESVFPAQKGSQESVDPAAWRPVVDVHEDEQSYLIDAELPGISRDEVKINYQDGTLTLSGERTYRAKNAAEGNEAGDNEAKKASCHRSERAYGKFFRRFKFPAPVNPDAISARFENGVLTIKVPKAEIVRPRQIEVQ